MNEPTPEQLAFGAFIRAAAKAANLHDQPLRYALNVALKAEAGHVTRPRTITRLATVLGLTIEGLLSHAPRPPSELGTVVSRGLARGGLTMRDVTARTGITAQQVQEWISGQHRPTVERLQALADLLGEPDLLNLVEPYTPVGRVKAACTSCGKERLLWPSQVADLCKTCAGRQTGLAKAERIRKRGRGGLYKLGQELQRHRKRWAEEHPEEAAAIRVRAVKAMHSRPLSEADMLRKRLGSLTLDPPGRFGLCRLCGRLTFFRNSKIDQAARDGREWRGELHFACYQAQRKAPEMARRTVRRSSSPDELAEAYATTVRYFRQKTESRRADRDEHHQVRPVAWLAKELGITRDSLHKRVQRFLALLPEAAVATGRVKQWRDILLPLSNESGGVHLNHVVEPEGAPQNAIQVAHLDPENVIQVAHP